ncbi:hypothetical protein ACM26V_06970 [Salipaludibacillus sp. HK11]|uniref:hypothetical protein n=1 Tax=Salipaludibacillus sp. HK11 TaxID=3394320 RepID=UPI0039FDA67F
MIKIDDSGLKEFQNKLKEYGTNSLTLVELFHADFMKNNTRFKAIDDMFASSPFEIETEDDFDAIEDGELDRFIKSVTKFNSWEEMTQVAATEWMSKKLFS